MLTVVSFTVLNPLVEVYSVELTVLVSIVLDPDVEPCDSIAAVVSAELDVLVSVVLDCTVGFELLVVSRFVIASLEVPIGEIDMLVSMELD